MVGFMLSDVYDSDDALNRSPALKPAVIKYGPDDSVPPFPVKGPSRDGKRESSSSSDSSEGRSRKHHRTNKRAPPTLGDVVLIGILGNRQDIASHAGENPLGGVSDSDDDSQSRVKLSPPPPPRAPDREASEVAHHALNLMPREHNRTNTLPSISELVSQSPVFPPHSHQRRPSERLIADQDSLATSRVGRYAVSPSNIPAQELLPALQSPPHSTAGSPENSQSLPSMSSMLRELGSVASSPFSISASSPPVSSAPGRERQMSGPLPPPTQIPTPYSHPSPMSVKDLTGASPASQPPNSWRPPVLKPDISNMTSSSYETPPGAPAVKSPANNYPTPADSRTVIDEGADPTASSGNLYKCQYPGCTAAAFQTQYLLNSHANVHSHERPHFCPVPGCPRGMGGKGFKRKNEMIRHGLVHDSPGYVCPFCTDQQHRYPRPDNLQRHVKAHHTDKNKDDPELRNVLAQRPKGSGRGRRRRGHS